MLMKTTKLIICAVIAFYFISCENDKDPFGHVPKNVFTFNEEVTVINVSPDVTHFKLSGRVVDLNEYTVWVRVEPGFTTATLNEQFFLSEDTTVPNTEVRMFFNNVREKSVDIRIDPEKITKEVQIRFRRTTVSYGYKTDIKTIDETTIKLVPVK